jgi:hypothetical protein
MVDLVTVTLETEKGGSKFKPSPRKEVNETLSQKHAGRCGSCL